ncbi:Signal recognition particle protein [Borealophlyctis nickersoniae]|nr:Signal recognition particle protein [Borealophlyctis nickersoniae]
MGYIDIWDQYQRAVEELYLSAPIRTRYVVKYRHCDGKLVLKVTDNVSCLKYRTDRLQDLKKFERLNLSMMQKMQYKKPVEPAEGDSAPGTATGVATGGGGLSTRKPPGTPKQSAKSTPAGGVGKKRKGKR